MNEGRKECTLFSQLNQPNFVVITARFMSRYVYNKTHLPNIYWFEKLSQFGSEVEVKVCYS